MYYKINDFLSDWDYESKATLKIFDNLTDKSLPTKVTPEGRSLGFLGWHIVLTINEMMSRTGLQFNAPPHDSPPPSSAAEIKNAYEKASASFVEELKKKWNDSSLEQEVDMYGEKWKNGATLAALITHQIHHRAQMTVLMRQAGLKVPGVYGPSKEEWVAMGMKPME
jgi:uncharacterized damage-inducible protein DinB